MHSNQDTRVVDILDIDAVNYAGAIGASAAGRVYALLANPDKEFDYRWMTGDGQMALDDVESIMDRLADFVCRTSTSNPETVYRHAVADEPDFMQLLGDWFAEPLARTTAYALFTSTCLAAFTAIKGEQRAHAAKAALAAQEAQPLKLEDSIFEGHGSLGEMLPHAVQALEDAARRDIDAAAAADAEIWIDEPMSAGAGDANVATDATGVEGLSAGGAGYRYARPCRFDGRRCNGCPGGYCCRYERYTDADAA